MLTNAKVSPNIGVRDVAVAREFYEKKLGLTPLKSDMPDEVQPFKSGNSTIEVYKTEFAGTNKATAMSWEVDALEEEVKNLRNKGVEFEHYEMPDAKLEGDIHVFGEFKAAWFKDPDGNILCMHTH